MIIGIVFAGLLLVALFVSLLRTVDKPKVLCVCRHCGNFGFPEIQVPGSALTTFLLLLFFALPGIFYALLREMGTKRVCPICLNEGMVPQDSPRGQLLQREFHPGEISGAQRKAPGAVENPFRV